MIDNARIILVKRSIKLIVNEDVTGFYNNSTKRTLSGKRNFKINFYHDLLVTPPITPII